MRYLVWALAIAYIVMAGCSTPLPTKQPAPPPVVEDDCGPGG